MWLVSRTPPPDGGSSLCGTSGCTPSGTADGSTSRIGRSTDPSTRRTDPGHGQSVLGGVMRLGRPTKRLLSTILLTAVVTGVLTTGASAWEDPLKGRYMSGAPLTICDQGS